MSGVRAISVCVYVLSRGMKYLWSKCVWCERAFSAVCVGDHGLCVCMGGGMAVCGGEHG